MLKVYPPKEEGSQSKLTRPTPDTQSLTFSRGPLRLNAYSDSWSRFLTSNSMKEYSLNPSKESDNPVYFPVQYPCSNQFFSSVTFLYRFTSRKTKVLSSWVPILRQSPPVSFVNQRGFKRRTVIRQTQVLLIPGEENLWVTISPSDVRSPCRNNR